MRYIFAIFFCVFAMMACRKSNGGSYGSTSGPKLTAIYCDSAGGWAFGYTGNLITSIVPDTNLGLITVDSTVNIQYSNIGSFQYVTLNLPFQQVNYLKYTLNSSRLPLRIDGSYTSGGVVYNIDFADFIYFPGTDLLDSVISYYNPFGGATDGKSQIVYKFIYTGQNISQIEENYVSPFASYSIDTMKFTYSNTPNIFRYTDSLLYIYAYPYTAFVLQTNISGEFFAETFSESTFNNLSISDPYGGVPEGYLSSTMKYSVNLNGKITEEMFSVLNAIEGKKYFYQ